jgi:hypothetical protein
MQATLYQELHSLFQEQEFVFMPNRHQFRRNLGNGFQNVVLSCEKNPTELHVEVHLGCRLNLIEDLAQQFLRGNESYRYESSTIIVSMGKLLNNKVFDFEISNKTEAADCAQQIFGFMQQQGFSFLNEVCSLKAVDKIMNEKPIKPVSYLNNQSHRCFKGLIAARLCDNPRFLDLVEIYSDTLQRQGQPECVRLNYDKLVNYLLYFSFN